LKKAPFSPFRTIPLFFKNFWNGLQFFAVAKFLQSCLVLKGRWGRVSNAEEPERKIVHMMRDGTRGQVLKRGKRRERMGGDFPSVSAGKRGEKFPEADRSERSPTGV
jgi:hypothetical protein